jgi:hypothetical protein
VSHVPPPPLPSACSAATSTAACTIAFPAADGGWVANFTQPSAAMLALPAASAADGRGSGTVLLAVSNPAQTPWAVNVTLPGQQLQACAGGGGVVSDGSTVALPAPASDGTSTVAACSVA